MMHVEQVTPGRWVCRGNFKEKDVPKVKGFLWDPTARCWWTPKADVAAKLVARSWSLHIITTQTAW